MAKMLRTAKSGSDWSLSDLCAYHVSLNEVDALTFFGLRELPQPPVDEELLNDLDVQAMQDEHNRHLIRLLDFAMDPAQCGEAAVDDFASKLLTRMGYEGEGRMILMHRDLLLHICGENRHAKTDACVIDGDHNNIILLVQEDKKLTPSEPKNAKAQLVAEAIAAFNLANFNWVKLYNLPPWDEKVIPGILMVGTLPLFFQIPITRELSRHVEDGTYPPRETVVMYCYPPVPRPENRLEEGMKSLEHRREILRCYEAFKTIVGI